VKGEGKESEKRQKKRDGEDSERRAKGAGKKIKKNTSSKNPLKTSL
jgi:hypothetical protein